MSLPRMLLLAGLCFCPMLSRAQDGAGATNPLTQFNWVHGPTDGNLKGIAEIKVPEGYVLAESKDAQKIFELMGNRPSGLEMGLLAPATVLDPHPKRSGVWFVLFRFKEIGYVKDDDKDRLDADKLLKAIKEGNDAANEYRKQRGVSPLTVTGWEQPPHYNPETHNLEWAIRGESDGESVVNYNTHLLGRKGDMEVVLLVDPAELAATMPEYRSIMAGYQYKQGETYAEYKPGDKLAKYGLAGLVTAGAVVVAAKTGLLAAILIFLKKGWKLVVLGVAAVVAAIKNFFQRLFGGGRNRPDSNSPPPA